MPLVVPTLLMMMVRLLSTYHSEYFEYKYFGIARYKQDLEVHYDVHMYMNVDIQDFCSYYNVNFRASLNE